MDFTQVDQSPARQLLKLLNLLLVLALHLGVMLGLLNGGAQRLIAVMHPPIETRIIEEIKPPPPELAPLPMPDIHSPPPPQSYVPPPEVQVSPPLDTSKAISAISIAKPEGPVVLISPPPQAPPSPPVPVPSVPASNVGVVCGNYAEVKEGMGDKFALLAEKEGIATAEVTLLVVLEADGQISGISVKSSSNSAAANLAKTAVRRMKCQGQGHSVQLLVPFSFKLQD